MDAYDELVPVVLVALMHGGHVDLEGVGSGGAVPALLAPEPPSLDLLLAEDSLLLAGFATLKRK